jgi:hypothetical protein
MYDSDCYVVVLILFVMRSSPEKVTISENSYQNAPFVEFVDFVVLV